MQKLYFQVFFRFLKASFLENLSEIDKTKKNHVHQNG